jgi:hypothetical protein
VNQVIRIKFARRGFAAEIRLQEFQQLLCCGVVEVRAESQFACWSTIQFRIDSVHQR